MLQTKKRYQCFIYRCLPELWREYILVAKVYRSEGSTKYEKVLGKYNNIRTF